LLGTKTQYLFEGGEIVGLALPVPAGEEPLQDLVPIVGGWCGDEKAECLQFGSRSILTMMIGSGLAIHWEHTCHTEGPIRRRRRRKNYIIPATSQKLRGFGGMFGGKQAEIGLGRTAMANALLQLMGALDTKRCAVMLLSPERHADVAHCIRHVMQDSKL